MDRQDRIFGQGLNERGRGRALVPEEMVAAALKRAGRDEFDDLSFVPPLRRLVTSCEAESDLNTLGRSAVKFEIRRSLRNLLEFERRERADPALLTRAIERPIFITGMPRSGSTFLHRLLVRDRAVAAPLSWRLVHPHPSAAGWLGEGLNRARVQAQFYLMRLLAPELNSLHEVAAGEPEECTDITAQVFQSLRYDSVYRVPSYQSWLERHGHVEAYRFHKRFLQHLDAQAPGRRWILKSPDHVFALDDILTVYPDSCWVFIHRDPVAVLASVARLTQVLRRPFARSVDLAEIGQQVCASWLDGAQRMMRAAAASRSLLHLHYREIVADPQQAAARLFRHGGHAASGEAAQRMRKWLGNRSNRQHRQHRQRGYDLASFGLNPEALRAQFKPYTDTFGIELEWPPRARTARSGRN
jgi:hypothetical protein